MERGLGVGKGRKEKGGREGKNRRKNPNSLVFSKWLLYTSSKLFASSTPSSLPNSRKCRLRCVLYRQSCRSGSKSSGSASASVSGASPESEPGLDGEEEGEECSHSMGICARAMRKDSWRFINLSWGGVS